MDRQTQQVLARRQKKKKKRNTKIKLRTCHTRQPKKGPTFPFCANGENGGFGRIGGGATALGGEQVSIPGARDYDLKRTGPRPKKKKPRVLRKKKNKNCEKLG